MYEQFYGLSERPFSITPDPRFVFLSRRHEDALAHLLYGIGRGGSGGFVQLTGEVGTGKTTLCRLVLEQVPEHTRIALILNPMLDPRELLRAICRELEAEPPDGDTGIEALGQALNQRLLEIHAAGERAVLIIDEAQNMSRETLEQVRLLTNLETATDKLLQIILLGQPELRELLSRPSLRQLAQRITARYHLAPLAAAETADYVRHRLQIAGAARCPFSRSALRSLHHVSGGVPRLINIIADRALMAGYAREADAVSPAMVRQAAAEVVVGDESQSSRGFAAALAGLAILAVLAVSGGMIWSLTSVSSEPVAEQQPLWRKMLDSTNASTAWREAAALWLQVDESDVVGACVDGRSEILTCHRLRGSWSLIRRLGQPVIIRLTEPAGGHVLALEVGPTQLRMRHAGQDFEAPIAQVDPRWLGDFIVIWPDTGKVWRRGDENETIAALKQLAAHDIQDPWQGVVSQNYGPQFEAWVRAFQGRHGLTQDGMAGPVTRLFLSAFSQHDKLLNAIQP
ncbi:MAG: AAA family ATPase [Wenzhouxiangellaceae bacterium]|nr:AAA family ATPase [Wenzhouxiangellaceae bacterium]